MYICVCVCVCVCVYNLLEKEMAAHFSILDWEITWTEDSDWLQSME